MCDSLVAVGSEAAGGITLFAKNSDRKPGERQPFLQFPAAHHPPRARVRCTHVEIPQAGETYRVMGHSPSWVWGFEHGVNEHGVAIGNQTVFSNEPLEEQPGLIGMDLVRLGLERGRDAREALEVIAGLIETHGKGGPALSPGGPGYHNSFLLADPESAWLGVIVRVTPAAMGPPVTTRERECCVDHTRCGSATAAGTVRSPTASRACTGREYAPSYDAVCKNRRWAVGASS